MVLAGRIVYGDGVEGVRVILQVSFIASAHSVHNPSAREGLWCLGMPSPTAKTIRDLRSSHR